MYDLNIEQKEDIIAQAMSCDRETSAEVMGELLMDENWSTWKMFEGLASDWLNGNADVRRGIDLACSALTGWNVDTIAQMILDRCAEYSDDEDDLNDGW